MFCFPASLKGRSNIIGIFLNGMVAPVLLVPFGVAVVTFRHPNLDLSNLWFQSITSISPGVKLFFRILAYCFSLMQACQLNFGFGIIGFIVILLILSRLERLTIYKSKRSKISGLIRKYRQLQIITVILNQLLTYVLPQTNLIFLVGNVMLGYLLIKMTGIVPHALIILDLITLTSVMGYIQLGFGLMADVERKSDNFLMGLQFQGDSSYRRRELKSCKELKIWAGPYFVIKKSTRIELFGLMAYYAMSCVISI